MFRALLISAVSMLTLVRPSVAQAPGQVAVVYTDGTERTVTDWQFIYHYGASDQPFTGGPYLELSKRTTDLLLEVVAETGNGGSLTEDRVIPVSDLASIQYRWGQGEQKDSVSRIVVTLTNGQELSDSPPLRPARKLLSTKPFVFATSIWLRGRVLVEGGKASFEARIDEPYGTGGPQGNLAQLRFRPATRP
jgi:hypothetical protein